MVVDLALCKQHLNVGHGEDDEYIVVLIEAAARALFRYLNRDPKELIDEKGELPKELQLAILEHVALVYRQRESASDRSFSIRPLSFGYLVDPYKKLC